MDVSYGGENGFNQAIELAAESLQNVKFIQEKKLIGRYFDEISQVSSRVVVSANLVVMPISEELRSVNFHISCITPEDTHQRLIGRVISVSVLRRNVHTIVSIPQINFHCKCDTSISTFIKAKTVK